MIFGLSEGRCFFFLDWLSSPPYCPTPGSALPGLLLSFNRRTYWINNHQSSPNYASVNTLQGPLCSMLARRSFEGVYLADGRRTGLVGVGERWRRRGIWMIGVKLQIFSQQHGPGMNILLHNTMHVSKYESAKDLAKLIFFGLHTCIQLNLVPWISEDSQEYYPWLEILFIENS